MLKNFFYLSVLSLGLVACGNGNDNNAPVYTGGAYGYNAYGNLCPSQVAVDWNNLIASRCNIAPPQYTGGYRQDYERQAAQCVWGAKQFQMQYPGINCQFSVADQGIQWCPGDNWRSQQYFEINDGVIQSIYTKFGFAASLPQNFNPNQFGPGWPGYPGDGSYRPGNYRGPYRR